MIVEISTFLALTTNVYSVISDYTDRVIESPTNLDPALAAMRACPPEQIIAMLHSGRHNPQWATQSFLASPSVWFIVDASNQANLTDTAGHPHPAAAELNGDPFQNLKNILTHPAFQSGRWFGYLSYELRHHIEGESLPPNPAHAAHDRHWPLIALGWSPDYQIFPACNPPTTPHPTQIPQGWQQTVQSIFPTRAAYESAIQRVIDYIAAGDVFQVNLAQRFTAAFPGHPRQLFENLATVSPAWYGAYLELPPFLDHHRVLASTSPELFLQLENRRVTTRPIKGTRPTTESNAAHALAASEKDAAELHMIVDLLRNDLGRVCSFGSVRVTQPRTVELHPTVAHGVATVTGTLAPSHDIVDLLKATLPGGSITGAPKIRAMQIIDTLEPAPRGPYCGCIGWLTADACCLNIAIRTLCLQRPNTESETTWQADFSVGGGIVADSHPAAEYDETLSKATAMLHALLLTKHI